MNRRSFLSTSWALLLSMATSAIGQQPGRRYRIGMLLTDPNRPELEKAFLDELGHLGFIEGRNLEVRWTYAPGDVSAQARDLIAFHPDVLVAEGTVRTRTLQSLTKTIPIVFVAGDPLAGGLVKDLARPGGNTTGVAGVNCELMTKELELLRELEPKPKTIVFITQSFPGYPCKLAIDAVRSQVKAVVFAKEDDAAGTIQAVQRENPDAIVNNGYTIEEINKAFGLKHRVPIISSTMRPGVLIAIHQHHVQVVRRHAGMVAKILNGANPGDLPVEFPLELQMEVDLRLAKQIGIQIPESILLRADRVIE